MSGVKVTWLGHSTLLFESPKGIKILVDPWLKDNPSCPADWKALDRFKDVKIVLATHGHYDHVGDLIPLCKAYKPTVACIYELGHILGEKGVENVSAMNKGGSQTIAGIRISMTSSNHSSSWLEADGTLRYAGDPAGFVLKFEDETCVYVSGDTNIFGDMKLIRELYQPTIACLPIGDHFTMGPAEAAKAIVFLGVDTVVPLHYGTFPLLTGTPAAVQDHIAHLDVNVLSPAPGETVSL